MSIFSPAQGLAQWRRGLLGLALLALASCATVPRERAGGAGAPEDEVAAAGADANAGAAELPLPAETPALPPPGPQTPVPAQNRVALLVPTTGGSAAVGQSIANAAAMALLDINERRFRLTTYNTAGPGGARGAAERAIADGAGVILGPLLAPDVRAAAPVARAAGVPIISFSNDAALAGGGVYVMGFQPAQSIARVVSFARSRGVERFAALVPAGTYGSRASTAFLRAVEASGGRVTGIATYTRDRRHLAAAARKVTDYDARLARASRTAGVRPDGTVAPVTERLGPVGFEALLIADSGSIAGAFAPALAQFGARGGSVRLLGTELWNNEPALRGAAAMQGAWFAAVPDNRFEQLASRYRARFGGRPSRLASLGYDGVLLVNALAGRWPLGGEFPRGALADPDGFGGIDGIFRFGTSGVAERGLTVRQIQPSGFAVVSSAPRSFGARVSMLN